MENQSLLSNNSVGARLPLVVLISGSGSNLQAIIDATNSKKLPIEIRAVISNVAEAYGLQRARRANIDAQVIDHRDFKDRPMFDQALLAMINSYQPLLIVLAGFMRILGADFVNSFRGKIINIHPSLLPAYPGLDTHQRALEDNVQFHGATVHFVTAKLDSGPIIVQGRVPVLKDDTTDTLQQRVHKAEHQIYPKAICWIAENRLSILDGKVLLDGEQKPEQQFELSEK